MILTKEQLTELETAAQPLMDWMKENLHPHTTAIVDGYHCELLEGLAQVLNNGPTQTRPPGWREPSSERQRLTDENTALKARCEELERLVMAQLPPDGPQQALAGGKE